jgi:hypothetical protein
MTSFFSLHRKPNGRMNALYIAEKVVQPVWAVWLDDRISSTYLNQQLGFKAAVSSTLHRNFPWRIELREGIDFTSWPVHTYVRSSGGRTENMFCCSVFWDITPCSPLKGNRQFRGTYLIHLWGRRARNRPEIRWQAEVCLPPTFALVSCLAYSSILKMEALYSSEALEHFSGLQGVISQKTGLFIITAVRTSNPIESMLTWAPGGRGRLCRCWTVGPLRTLFHWSGITIQSPVFVSRKECPLSLLAWTRNELSPFLSRLFQNLNLYIHSNSVGLHISTLEMEEWCTSEKSATLVTSTRCRHPRTELISTVNNHESIKSVTLLSLSVLSTNIDPTCCWRNIIGGPKWFLSLFAHRPPQECHKTSRD